MDVPRLDALVRSFSASLSRRVLCGGLAATALGLAAARFPGEAAANERRRKRKKKNKSNKNKNRRRNAAPPAPPAPDPITRVDATCVGQSQGDVDIVGNQRLAQSFTALATGSLVSAEFLIEKTAGTVGDYVLRLSPVDGSGVPTNTVLAETSVADAAVPDGESTVTFAFANPFAVAAGAEYALVLTRPGSEELKWPGREGNPCPGQAFFSPDQTAPFVVAISDQVDFIFTIFVRS